MKRLLIVVLAVLAFVPVATGLLAIIGGPTVAPGGGPTTASIDSEYRFVNVFWLAAGVILVWSLFRAAERALITRVALIIAASGGIARLISIAVVGLPHPVFIATIGLELVVVPLVIWWHSRVFPVRRMNTEMAN
ncbi:hypothetical protein BH11ACT3_BH11ACT3_00130 [soil metagenome]